MDAPGTLVHGRCPEEKKVTVTLTFDYAVTGKPLITNSSQVWEPGTPDYQLCAPRLGCHPPADHCAREWIAETVYGLDTPQHSFVSTVHCDQTWLVLEINRNAAVCGAGGRPGCSAPPDTTRYFLRWETHGWRVLAGSRDAGCPTVVASEPGFPVQLCDLPAPS